MVRLGRFVPIGGSYVEFGSISPIPVFNFFRVRLMLFNILISSSCEKMRTFLLASPWCVSFYTVESSFSPFCRAEAASSGCRTRSVTPDSSRRS